MIKPNWDIFKAKFNENPQKNFEWFCYILFCKEFNKDKGISRYKNQAGIETNPIIFGNDVVGWQAKYYDTKLTNHKDELISSLVKSKKYYTNLTKIIFYTNQEWGQGKKENDPKTKIEVEEKAKELKIEVDWRTASYFESPFVIVDNEIIAYHFFSLDNSIFYLIEQKEKHSENIFYEIQTDIDFNKQKIEIDRSGILEKIQEGLAQKQILILSGEGGVGKTAVIKKYYEKLVGKIPFYIFKATEFNVNDINSIFGNLKLEDFICFHNNENDKIIIIDSAEKLLDLKNSNPFKEFLSTLIINHWKIIFTTRNYYLEDINFQFIEIYRITYIHILIQNLNIKELKEISKKHDFLLPVDHKLLDLIKNPFYLSEYLRFYESDESLDYLNFKNKLWERNIIKLKPSREQCFLKIAFDRVNEGQFFIIPKCDSQILDEFVYDGILRYETTGYFITHDIYEEWALEKIINTEFIKKENNINFFKSIGETLAVRRSFRNWVSEKLLLNDTSIKLFIEEVISSIEINTFWKDEILISVLLSDYSDFFFNIFKDKLLERNHLLLRKIALLLRVSCKEVDYESFKKIGIEDINLFSIKYVLTKPRGNGWNSLIKFVYENKDIIGIGNVSYIFPVINDWNIKYQNGETTRFSSLIALEYYKWLMKKNLTYTLDREDDKILQTILFGAKEIKNELIEIFNEIIDKKWNNHRDPYNDLSKKILTSFEGISVCQVIPTHVLKLADLYWFDTPKERNNYYYDSSIGVDKYYGLKDTNIDYFPPSAYQTSIFSLLCNAFKETLDFIIDFTNKATEHYSQSSLDKNIVEEIELKINDKFKVKQFISNRLWCTYRGTQVAPHVLESMLMALEKFILEYYKDLDAKILEKWLIYILKKSKNASLTGLVSSIVLAYPEKTFNVALILFKTKELFFYDKNRCMLEHQVFCTIGAGVNGQLFQDERIKSRDLNHRKNDLEWQFLMYQCFRSNEISEEESENMQKKLWEILDNYYKEIPPESEQTSNDKTWRLFLARMDKRKMKTTAEDTEKGFVVNFSPELDSNLKKYSDESVKKSTEPMKYSSLQIWASYKLKNDERYKQYEQYESNPLEALKEVKKLLHDLKNTETPKQNLSDYSEIGFFHLFNQNIPPHVCSVLIKHHYEILTKNDKKLCRNVILDSASSFLEENYQYQIFDGVEYSILTLPILLKEFPKDKGVIKKLLLLNLFNSYPIGMYCKFSDYSINAIHSNMWIDNFNEAFSLLLGYFYLKPKYEESRDKLRNELAKKRIYQYNESILIKRFLKEYKTAFDKVINNEIKVSDIVNNLEKLELSILRTAFKLIPTGTEKEELITLAIKISNVFGKELVNKKSDDRIDYEVKHEFLEKFSYFVLRTKKERIKELLASFLDNFIGSESISDLFKEFIYVEDKINQYENFWTIWNLFKNKIIDLCKDGEDRWCRSEIIRSYLFASLSWNEKAKEWHTLKIENSKFLKSITENLGHCPSTLYSISKLLNGIGSIYLNNGILWISEMIKNNINLQEEELEVNTVYYLENITRKYIFENQEKIKRIKTLKQDILIILDFLVNKESVIGYMLRENIL
jgi:hypothetical protein